MSLVFKNALDKVTDDEPIDKEYRKLEVDELPILIANESLNYKDLLKQYFTEHQKDITPVKTRKGATPIPNNIKCPKCNAPHNYLYDNNGGRGQYQCKICKCNFNLKNYYSKPIKLKCPHCSKALSRIKERSNFFVHKCTNNDCSYYQNKLNSMSDEETKRFEKDPQAFKVRYIYREFDVNFAEISKDSPINSKVSLPNIMSSSYVLGLIMTYHVNYGLSLRKTAAILYDIHGYKISHQTIKNYAEAVSVVTKPLLDNYPYEPTGSICGDETYIKVNGKWHYICFFFDAVKKTILSYRVSPKRDTELAIKAIYDVITKFKKVPENLNLVVDGNPIYLLARLYFAQHDIKFNVTQVIGLTNDDPISIEHRPLKQIIERLNRTFKRSYKITNGFNSTNGSLSFVTLFCVYFNFLRPHSSLEKRVPIIIPELEKIQDMPSRWLKLIELSQKYCIETQKANAS